MFSTIKNSSFLKRITWNESAGSKIAGLIFCMLFQRHGLDEKSNLAARLPVILYGSIIRIYERYHLEKG